MVTEMIYYYNGSLIENIPHLSGIYKIGLKGYSYFYVGSATNLYKRCSEHFSKLRKFKHENNRLQNVFNKYTDSKWYFEILEIIDNKYWLLYFEQRYIDYFGFENLLNISKTAGSTLGNKLSEEARAKISKNNIGKTKGRQKTVEQRRKISKSLTGKKVKQETKEKISKTLSGIKRSAETCQKISYSKKNKKSVIMYDLITNTQIKIFNSISDASKETNTHPSNIVKVCKQERKHAGGFFWKFA